MPTNFNLYCNASRHTSDPADRYLLIGPVSYSREAKREIGWNRTDRSGQCMTCDNAPTEWRWANDEQDVPANFDPDAARNLLARFSTPDFWRRS